MVIHIFTLQLLQDSSRGEIKFNRLLCLNVVHPKCTPCKYNRQCTLILVMLGTLLTFSPTVISLFIFTLSNNFLEFS